MEISFFNKITQASSFTLSNDFPQSTIIESSFSTKSLVFL